ncbi:hypothetical protein [Nocardia alni]|uniref:hypothetical protein n=1 Tax=Nocardia alni TaxID=2815723 RepID=UPI001C23C709|nr:hypothetical protein [Nocardia alni]
MKVIEPPVSMARCRGLWRRTLLIEADGTSDRRTDVRWLQGHTRFVDLRRPAPRPDFGGVRCKAELGAQQQDWLIRQDGFAGELTQSGDVFHWQRHIELHPPGPFPDEGRMSLSADVLVEKGVHADYVEHWTRDTDPGACWALDMASDTGGRALLLRVGDMFGWARFDPSGGVELSLGDVTDDEWMLTDSTLPYRERRTLAPRWHTPGRVLHTDDIDDIGTPITRTWLTTYTEGLPTL